jgi:hypothetical protein
MLREKLEQIRDEKANEYFNTEEDKHGYKIALNRSHGFEIGFNACQSELLPLIEEMRGVLEFYGDFHNWHGSPGCKIKNTDRERVSKIYKHVWSGGKKARECLTKLQEYENQQPKGEV